MDLQAFTHRFKMSKTLRFKLIPEGETLANIEKNGILTEDYKRAEEYKKAKKILDAYHREFISNRLTDENRLPTQEELDKFAALYYGRKQDETQKAAYNKAKEALCKRIASLFSKDSANKEDLEFKALFGKELIEKVLPEKYNEEEKETIEYFKGFTVYFTNYNTTRKNMYTEKEQSTGIANRIVNDNLPKFFDNVRIGERVLRVMPNEDIASVNEGNPFGITVQDILSPSFSRFVFTQEQIERYNGVIGGYTNSDGSKVQGLNEKINQYNQTHKDDRLPNLKILFKQILAEEDTISYVPHEFLTDDETLEAVAGIVSDEKIEQLREIVDAVSKIENTECVFIPRKAVGAISQQVYGYYGTISDNLPAKGGKETGSCCSIEEMQHAGDLGDAESGIKRIGILEQLIVSAKDKLNAVLEKAVSFRNANLIPYKNTVRLAKNTDAIIVVKEVMDALKEFQLFAEQFYLGKDEPNADPVFYGAFCNAFEQSLSAVIKLYDRVRNYIAKKPYSLEKYKLFFENPQFMGGWDINMESSFTASILLKDRCYYLAVLKDRKAFSKLPKASDDEPVFQKMIYRQIPNAAKYFSSKQIIPQHPPKDIVEILKKKKEDSSSLSAEERSRFIEYVQNSFIPNYEKLTDADGTPFFDFRFKDPSEYAVLNDFFEDVDSQAFVIRYDPVSVKAIEQMVKDGDIYLFKFYCKDFSVHSKGVPNLHTLFFKALFDERSIKEGAFKLCGGAELFYRPGSLNRSETTVHSAHVPLKNKNPLNRKAESVFPYEIVKDRRFTAPHFELHFPIEMNFREAKCRKKELDDSVRLALAEQRDQYVIGIDRGERNLLYVSLINGNGQIMEQQSLNLIGGRDYRDLLEQREKDRLDARREWQTINGIKELKEGYLSQVVNRICQWVVQYGAIIVMEDLNERFKQIRSGIERSVYQKFETMLTNKLCFLADKRKEPTEIGGIMNAYQLTTPSTTNKELRGQNGIIFYVSPWNTSKIDPTTGFAKLIFPKYKNESDAKDFLGRFRSIRYNKANGYFEFLLRYSDFKDTQKDYTNEWTVCTYGDRIETVRDGRQLNQWVNRKINLTSAFAALLRLNGVEYESGELKEKILSCKGKEFFAAFMHLLSMTFQMRNSITGSTAPEDDYMISPVMNSSGEFYDSRKNRPKLPSDADANGAYNIARKGLMVVQRFRDQDEVRKVQTIIKNEDWLAFAQTHPCV